MSPQALNTTLWAVWFAYWVLMGLKVKRDAQKEPVVGRLAYLSLLLLGFSLLFSSLLADSALGQPLPLPPGPATGVLGDVLTALGLGYACWARVHLGAYWSGRITIKEGHRLIRTGPYRWTRHPIYSGLLLAALGSAVTLWQWRGLVGLALITAAMLTKLRREESVLVRQFGEEYERYRREVKALVPFVH